MSCTLPLSSTVNLCLQEGCLDVLLDLSHLSHLSDAPPSGLVGTGLALSRDLA